MIVPMTSDHLYQVGMRMRDVDRREVLATFHSDEVKAYLDAILSMKIVGYALLNDKGEAILIGGLYVGSPGVGTAWIWGTDDSPKHAIEFTRAAKKATKELLASGTLNRIQAFSAEFHTEAHRWLEVIGLKYESTMQKLGKNGEDFFVYAAVRG